MPLINFSKCNDITKHDKKQEDQIIVVKKSDTKGEIYYDYDATHRLKITSETPVYLTSTNITSDTQTINISTLTSANDSKAIASSDLSVNSVVIDNTGVMSVITTVTSTTISVKKLPSINAFGWRVYK